MNLLLNYYEAPRAFEPDGFVDPITLPHPAIRVITPPGAKSGHALAATVCRSLGITRDNFTKRTSEKTLLDAATAWALAKGVTHMYIAHAEDLTPPVLDQTIGFTTNIGAALHLVFARGQVYEHATVLHRHGFTHHPFTDLPEALRKPAKKEHRLTIAPTIPPLAALDLPDDHWPTFRHAYLHSLPPSDSQAIDRIYVPAYRTALASGATTLDQVEALAGRLWTEHGINHNARLVVARAMQAALFRNGWHLHIDLDTFTRRVRQHHINLLTADHYQAMATYPQPWKPAATLLHAEHIDIATMSALRVNDVTRDGTIPTHDITPSNPAARTLLAAARWHAFTTADDTNPPLLVTTANNKLQRGIRQVITDLELPLSPYSRNLANDRGAARRGLRIERLTA